MAFSHGSKAVLKINSTDYSAYVSKVDHKGSLDTNDVTCLGRSHKVRIAGLLDSTISLDGKFDPAIDAVLYAAHIGGAVVTYEYHPAGTTAGLPKYSGSMLVKSYGINTAVESEATFSAELEVQDAEIRGTN